MQDPLILIIDDEPDNFDVIETLLNGQYHLHYSASGKDAIKALDILNPDLILLDVMMPEVDGIEVCRRIKSVPDWDTVPIIMITSLASKQDLAACLNAGADDFINKPVNRAELMARIRSMLRIRQQYQQLDLLNNELEERVQRRTAQLQTIILQDALTQLPSRTALLQTIASYVETNSPFTLVYLDCDQFKLVNGSFGYEIGNQLLSAIAKRLQQYLQPGDLCARMGEDEFCFFLGNNPDPETILSFISSLQKSFITPFSVANCEIFITASIGITSKGDIQQKAEEYLQDVDTAMYQAKQNARGSFQFFDHTMRQAIVQRLTLENDLQRALERQEFIVYYQPIINLKTQKLMGFEALVRWQHPQRGMVSPAEFIPSLEATGLIVPLGLLVLRLACDQLHSWHQQGREELTMSVNLSVRQFSCSTLLSDIDQILAATAVNPRYLKLEITESAIMDNAETAIALTEKVRARGLQISIDDFGTGYSSLGYLHRFAVDNLKIDRSFVNDLEPNNRNYSVVNSIVTLAQQLGLAVIAEGIETSAQLDYLQRLGCEYGQGYLFSAPLTTTQIERKYFSEPLSFDS